MPSSSLSTCTYYAGALEADIRNAAEEMHRAFAYRCRAHEERILAALFAEWHQPDDQRSALNSAEHYDRLSARAIEGAQFWAGMAGDPSLAEIPAYWPNVEG